MGEVAGWPRILVVTDRRRLVVRVGARDADWPELLLAQIAGAMAGGADLVQVREPDLEAGPLRRFLGRVFERVKGSADRLVVNDRVDVALASGAAGVHLAARSLAVADVRLLAPADKSWVIGRSVHDSSAAVASRDASYLVAGTVRASEAKPGRIVLGWEGLRQIVNAAGATPVVGIGGLGATDVPSLVAAGATGLAGIGCFLPDRPGEVATLVQDRVSDLRNMFDTAGGEYYTRRAGR